METMTSLERVLMTLGHKEPDRVPVFLLMTMHGAKELGMTIKEYFSDGRNVAEGQLRLFSKYGNDCLYAFFYAPVVVEAWGGEVIYREDGPPNSGEPFIRRSEDILKLNVPDVSRQKCLLKVLDAIKLMKEKTEDKAPIIGVVMSPFSLPVMQMGFEKYIEILYERPDLFQRLMQVNEEFTVAWGNAQLNAGATALAYFDPVSSSTIIPRDLYLRSGYQVAKRTIARFKGPAAYHLASGRALLVIEDVATTGTPIISASSLENLAEMKNRCRNKITILGNLNGIEMCRWTPDEAEKVVKEALKTAGPGGGFILSDNHGEIPFQVEEETLFSISETVKKFGNYPISIR